MAACESTFGLAFLLDVSTVSHDFTFEAIDCVGIRDGLYSGTCPDAYTDLPKFSAEWESWLVVSP